MKNLFITIISFFLTFSAFSQKVTVYELGKEIDNMTRKGMATTLQLDNKFVEKMWKKKIKSFGGKSSSSKNGTIISGATIPSISKNPVNIVTSINKVKEGVEVFWAIDMGTSYVVEGGSGWSSAKKLLTDFGKEAYIEDINIQIKDAEKAHNKAIKAFEKERQEGENLVKAIEKNGVEKIKLEEELVQNGEDLVQLKKDQEQNTKDQENAKKDADKMKVAVDAVRAKLDGVE